MRAILLPPKLDEKTVTELVDLADRVVATIDSAGDPTQLIEEFNARTDRAFDSSDFHSASESVDTRTFVIQALRQSPRRINDITRDELLEIIRRIMDPDSEPDQIYCLELLERNVPHPDVSGLIFWPNDPNPTPESILERALAYQPIILPSPRNE